MKNAKRVFSTINTRNGAMGWYFHAREGSVGPFVSYGQALSKLYGFIQKAIESGSNGGRPSSENKLPSPPETNSRSIR